MSGTSIGGIRAAATRGQGGPGLKQMRENTPRGLCPFCLDRIPVTGMPGRRPTYCLGAECAVAYFRCWRRDQRHPPQPVHHVVPRWLS